MALNINVQAREVEEEDTVGGEGVWGGGISWGNYQGDIRPRQ